DQVESRLRAMASAQALNENGGADAAQRMFAALAQTGEAADRMMKQIQGGGPKSIALLGDLGIGAADIAAALNMPIEKFKTATIGAAEMSNAIDRALQARGATSLATLAGSWSNVLGKAKEGLASLFQGID